MNLRQLGEDRFLQQLLRSLKSDKSVVLGAGDDCALAQFGEKRNLLVLKTDSVVEKVHFVPGANPRDVGWKAMMRPLSDFAAVSAIPQFALVTVIVSANRSANWVRRVYDGLKAAANKFDVKIVGGETSNTKGPAAISVNVTGCVEKNRWVARHGGKAGDDLFVTGELGASRRGKHLRFIPRIKESRWLTENFVIHAMMDLSDGLGADLPRLARASNVKFKLDEENLPLSRGATIANAISDGEDYELLFAIAPGSGARLQQAWRKRFPKVPLTRIGRLFPRSAIRNPKLKSGYVHFK